MSNVRTIMALATMSKVDMARDLVEQTIGTIDRLNDSEMLQCVQNILADIAWLYEKLADIADSQEGEA